jgi:hypothetical protein
MLLIILLLALGGFAAGQTVHFNILKPGLREERLKLAHPECGRTSPPPQGLV